MQTPENHWCLKRREPPRLPPGVDGYFYNFATDTVADDVSYILLLGRADPVTTAAPDHPSMLC